MKLLLKIGLVGFALYCAALLYVYVKQRSFMYFPPMHGAQADVFAARGETILNVSLGGTGEMRAIYGPPPNDDAPVILFFHGNGSAAHQYTPYFDDFKAWGAGFLAAEYPGYAGNLGAPNEADIFASGQAHYDALLGQGIKPEKIYIFGHSLGAAVAVDVAKNNKAKGLILGAPFLSMKAMARQQMPFFPTGILIKDGYRSDLKIIDIETPLLIVHGSMDEMIPLSQAEQLYGLKPGEKQFAVIENGRHDFWNTAGPLHIQRFIARQEAGISAP